MSKLIVPKANAPKANAPKVDTPKANAPKVDTPKVDAPKVDAPKVDPSKVNAPKVQPHKAKHYCISCNVIFPSQYQQSTHQRTYHQPSVTHGGRTEYRHEDDHFHCPNVGWCDYKNRHAGAFRKHWAACQAPVQKPGPNPIEGVGRLVASVDQIEGLSFHILCPRLLTNPCLPFIANDTLHAVSYQWNKLYRLLICTECHIGVLPSEAIHHHRNHANPRPVADLESALKAVPQGAIAPGLPDGYDFSKPCNAIEGLSMYPGLACLLCENHRTYRHENCMKTHFSEDHKGKHPSYLSDHRLSLLIPPGRILTEYNADRNAHIRKGQCQTMYLHRHTQYFLVSPPAPRCTTVGTHFRRNHSPSPDLVADDYDYLIHTVTDKIKAFLKGTQPQETGDLKDTSNWLVRTNISKYISDLLAKGVTHESLLVVTLDEPLVQSMVPALGQWIHETMITVGNTGQLLKRILVCETSYVPIPFSPLCHSIH